MWNRAIWTAEEVAPAPSTTAWRTPSGQWIRSCSSMAGRSVLCPRSRSPSRTIVFAAFQEPGVLAQGVAPGRRQRLQRDGDVRALAVAPEALQCRGKSAGETSVTT
jgi:hypothetical protein